MTVLTQATSFVPLWDRASEWRLRLSMIEEAKSFLYASTYYVEPDAYGAAWLSALLAAAKRGVHVHVLVDDFGQRLGGTLMTGAERAGLEASFVDLRRAGASVVRHRPKNSVLQWLGGGQHVKIQVSDAGQALFGSSNITRSSFEGWNEYSVAVSGPVAAVLLESFRAFGGRVDDAHLERLRAMAPANSDAAALEYWLCNPEAGQGALGPLGHCRPNAVTEGLTNRINAARSSLAVTSFYFKPVRQLQEALIRAAKRGVRVEVFHSHRDALPATDLAWLASASGYAPLLEAGVRIFENTRGEHSKLVLVDGQWAAFGSYNFEHAAHDRLAEAMLASEDARAVQPVADTFAALREDPANVQVTRASMARWPRRLAWRVVAAARLRRWL